MVNFLLLFNKYTVFNYFDGWRFPEKPVAPRRRRPQPPINRQPFIVPVNNAHVEPDDEDSDDATERASRRL